MKKIIILSYLIGLIGFQSFTRENATINFAESERLNARKEIFRPLGTVVPNIVYGITIKDYNIPKTNPSPDTLKIFMDEGDINLTTRLGGLESENRATILQYAHFESNSDSNK
jgi:hypothetical protein